MFGIGLPEILVILLVFVLLFGADKLPNIGKNLGEGVRELRRIAGENKDGPDA